MPLGQATMEPSNIQHKPVSSAPVNLRSKNTLKQVRVYTAKREEAQRSETTNQDCVCRCCVLFFPTTGLSFASQHQVFLSLNCVLYGELLWLVWRQNSMNACGAYLTGNDNPSSRHTPTPEMCASVHTYVHEPQVHAGACLIRGCSVL